MKTLDICKAILILETIALFLTTIWVYWEGIREPRKPSKTKTEK